MKKTILITFAALCLVSCDFLDLVPDKVGTVEYAFGERSRAIGYLATCYSYLPQLENEGVSPGRTVGPECYQYYDAENNGNKITRIGNNINSPLMNYWDGGGGVAVSSSSSSNKKDMFSALRSCNLFLENIYSVPDMSRYEKDQWAAEVNVLKAFYHWWLVQLYGPIPVIRENLPVNASPSEVMVHREPVDDVIDYVVELLDSTFDYLPDVVDSDLTDMGRITLPAAMALKAKILTHHASPFYNGNTGYANFTDKRGTALFPQTYDPRKWTKAAEACRAAIDKCEELGYCLYEFEVPIGTEMTDSTRYVLTPSSVVTVPWNTELIWGLSRADVKTVQQNCMPMLTAELRHANLRSRFSPSLATAEAFYSSHGVPIEEDVDWLDNNWYNDRYKTRPGDDEHRYVIDKSSETAILHFNREYRFYGSICFDRQLWYGAGVANASEDNQLVVLARGNEAAGKKGIERYSVTGYLIRKLVSINTAAPGGSFAAQQYPWPVIRLADLYLLYAEALNESLDAPTAEVYEYVNRVRARAGLGTVEESWENYSNRPDKYKNKEGMREIIHQERMIELAFEGHYYFDIKRWSGGSRRARYDIMTEMNAPIRGWNVDGENAESYYITRAVTPLQFTFRDYLWPLKESSLITNTNLVQNPGW